MTDSNPYEFFETPAWCVDRLMDEHWNQLCNADVIDPCTGTLAIPKAVDAYLESIGAQKPCWQLRDIDWKHSADYRGFDVAIGDYVEASRLGSVDLAYACIMNPPFSRAAEFLVESMQHCDHVFMLQRLNWLASRDRHRLLSRFTPSVLVLPNRPDFTGQGGDSIDYAWFYWSANKKKNPTVKVLGVTALEERRKPRSPKRCDKTLEMVL